MGKVKKKNNIPKEKSKNASKNSLGFGFFVVPLIILMFAIALIVTIMEDRKYIYVSPVLKNYQAMEKTEDKPLESYYLDELALFYDEKRYQLINDYAEYLYDKTGVRVFLWTMSVDDGAGNFNLPSEEEAEQTCKEIQQSLSEYGVDVVLMFTTTDTGFAAFTYATDEVKENFGDKFEKMLKQYLFRNYNTVGEFDDLFIFSYMNLADRLMGGITPPWTLYAENLKVCIIGTVVLVVLIGSVIFYRKVGRKI